MAAKALLEKLQSVNEVKRSRAGEEESRHFILKRGCRCGLGDGGPSGSLARMPEGAVMRGKGKATTQVVDSEADQTRRTTVRKTDIPWDGGERSKRRFLREWRSVGEGVPEITGKNGDQMGEGRSAVRTSVGLERISLFSD